MTNGLKLVRMRTVDWVAILSTIVGIVPLCGIPGGIALAFAAPALELIYWGRFTTALQRMTDDVWGVALILTLLWTPALSPVWRLVDRWKPGLSFWRHFGWACLGMWIWATVATLILSELIIHPRRP
jgi:hypothetical protein